MNNSSSHIQHSVDEEHYLLQYITEKQPEIISVFIDGVELFRAKFTAAGIEDIFDQPIDIAKPRWLMTISFDNSPIPIYSLNLGGETG